MIKKFLDFSNSNAVVKNTRFEHVNSSLVRCKMDKLL
jgi:hypothetical protein